MIRKQIYITQEQDRALKQLAESQGLTEAEIVRAALDRLAEVTYQASANSAGRISEAALKERYMTDEQEARGREAGVRTTLDQRFAAEAWQRELAFMKSLAAGVAESAGDTTWRFNREELYEERLDKVLRRH